MKSHFLKKLQLQSIISSMKSAGEKNHKIALPTQLRSGTYCNAPSRGKCSVNQWQRKCVILSHIASFADDRRMQIASKCKWSDTSEAENEADKRILRWYWWITLPCCHVLTQKLRVPPFLIIIVRVCLSMLRQLPHVQTAADTWQ